MHPAPDFPSDFPAGAVQLEEMGKGTETVKANQEVDLKEIQIELTENSDEDLDGQI